jgi:hypothetical protein
MTRFKPPNALGAISSNSYLAEPKTPMVTFTHFVREIEGGVEMRSRFWLGWQIQDKKPVVVNNEIPLELVKGLAHHCPREYTNLTAILPSVYAENAHIADPLEDFR